jgi:predicted NAD/FAD-binding protein
VNAVLSELPSSQRHLSHPIHGVGNNSDGRVFVEHIDGKREEFDHVIMATPSYVTLDMLRNGGGIEADEQRVFEQFRWSHNETVLHSDTRVSSLLILQLNSLCTHEYVVADA